MRRTEEKKCYCRPHTWSPIRGDLVSPPFPEEQRLKEASSRFCPLRACMRVTFRFADLAIDDANILTWERGRESSCWDQRRRRTITRNACVSKERKSRDSLFFALKILLRGVRSLLSLLLLRRAVWVPADFCHPWNLFGRFLCCCLEMSCELAWL